MCLSKYLHVFVDLDGVYRRINGFTCCDSVDWCFSVHRPRPLVRPKAAKSITQIVNVLYQDPLRNQFRMKRGATLKTHIIIISMEDLLYQLSFTCPRLFFAALASLYLPGNDTSFCFFLCLFYWKVGGLIKLIWCCLDRPCFQIYIQLYCFQRYKWNHIESKYILNIRWIILKGWIY